MPYDENLEAETPKTSPTDQPGDEEDDGEASALLPKYIFAGKDIKPGDEVTLKVVRILEDEVEVEYAKSPSPEPETEGSPGKMDQETMNRLLMPEEAEA